MTLGISILYSKAAKEMPDLLAFKEPLSDNIWLCIATAYLIMSLMIYITARLTPSEWESPHPCDDNPQELENIWSLRNSFWLTLGSIMAQGCDILPKGLSTRMLTSMWWFFSLIITASYTANLAAFLTNERMEPTIESYEDLAKQSVIKYGCVDGGATATFFRDSNVSTFQKMWSTMISSEPWVFQPTNKDGVKNVKTRKKMYAFFMESSQIEYERERDCELTQVGSWLDTKGYGIAMPINSPYRTSINEAILRLQENGILRKLKDKWWKQERGGGQCNETEHSAADSATELGIDQSCGRCVCGVNRWCSTRVRRCHFRVPMECTKNIRRGTDDSRTSFRDGIEVRPESIRI
ncbi:Ligand-gated ion channel [Popillia japonica]